MTEKIDADNPFSYKTFLKRSGDDQVEKKKGKKKQGSGKTKQKTSKQSDNPFSFKNFVATKAADDDEDQPSVAKVKHPLGLGSSDDSDGPVLASHDTIVAPSKPLVATKKLFSSSESDSDGDDNTPGPPVPTLPLPVESLNQLPFPIAMVSDSSVSLVTTGRAVVARSDSSSSDQSDGDMATALSSIVGTRATDISSFAYDETLLTENSKLKEENESLRTEVSSLKDAVQAEKKICSDLRTTIVRLKKKESEETKALENLVAKVEENLVASTQRASAAEANIVELNKEIITLKKRLAGQSLETVHQQHEQVLSAVREKAAYVSQNLQSAAEKADQSIRDLLSGVDTLKNLSDVLLYIDRIAVTKSNS